MGRGLGWPWGYSAQSHSTQGHSTQGSAHLGWPTLFAEANTEANTEASGQDPALVHKDPVDPAIEQPGSDAASSSDTAVSRETSKPADTRDAEGRDHSVAGASQGRVSREDDVSRGTSTTAGSEDLTDLNDGSTPLASAIALDVKRRSTLVGAPLPRPNHTRVLTVANQKGGVGKTTSAVNIAAALAQSGMRVLVIDLDPQGNASTALGVDHRSGIDSIYDVLVDGLPMSAAVVESANIPGLFCAPSTIDLAGAEIELVSLVAREGRLAKALEAHLADTAYDYVFIDCPPSLGLLTVNAFVAAREVFIPIQCEYYALEGLSQLLRNVDLIKTHLNPRLKVSTILLTMFDGRTRLSAQVAEEVREHFPAQTLRTTIPRSVRVSEAPSFGETVMTYDPLSSGALAYLEAASQIAHRDAGSTTEGAHS